MPFLAIRFIMLLQGMISENYIIFGVITLFQELW